MDFHAFSDEMQKIAARKGLKLIRQMVGRGDISAASQLAKKPGVLRDVGFDMGQPFMAGGKPKWMEREYLGSQIKHLGDPGQEQLSTLVADPIHGITVRKIRHSNAVTTPEMNKLVGSTASGAPEFAAKRLEDTRHGLSGRHVSFNEYVPGVGGDVALKGPRKLEARKAIDSAVSGLSDSAGKKNIHIGDVRDENAIVRSTPQGLKAKFVDFTAARGGAPAIAQSGRKPTTEEILKKTFRDPDFAARQQYQAEKATELHKAQKPKDGWGKFKAQQSVAPVPKKSTREEMIEAFMRVKRE